MKKWIYVCFSVKCTTHDIFGVVTYFKDSLKPNRTLKKKIGMLHTIWYKKTIVPNTTPSQLKVYFSSQSNLKIIFIYLKLPMNE